MREFTNSRNPILPLDIHIPDSEAHVMPDGNLYIYGSYDGLPDTYCSEEYHPVSTPDMKHWTIYDASLRGEEVPWFDHPDAPSYRGIVWKNPTPFAQQLLDEAAADRLKKEKKKKKGEEEKKKEKGPRPPLLYAPDCIHKDGKYYLYICMEDDSEGVVVSDRPEGPFSNPVQLPCGGMDPAIFIDDDGQAYYYFSQFNSRGVKLNDDLISFDETQIVDNLVTEQEHFFHEGSSMRKIGDTYYYLYADMERGRPTALGYATSKNPLGPFTYQGIIIDNQGCDPEVWNNHGSIECFNGQWYVFYHRSSRGSRLFRRLCIEPITVGSDGRIAEVLMTSQGPGAPFASGEALMGYQACGLKGSVYIDADERYEESLQHIADGDEAVFRYIESDHDWTEVTVTGSGCGKVEVYLNETLAGSVILDGNSQDVAKKTTKICVSAGKYEVTLKFKNPEEMKIYEVVLK